MLNYPAIQAELQGRKENRGILSFGNEKKNKFSFCISLVYS